MTDKVQSGNEIGRQHHCFQNTTFLSAFQNLHALCGSIVVWTLGVNVAKVMHFTNTLSATYKEYQYS